MSSYSSSSSVGYPNWVRGGLVAKLGTRRGHKHLRSGNEEEKDSVGPRWRGGEAKEIEGGRREGKRRSAREYPRHFSLSLSLGARSRRLSFPLSNERMHERLLQTVESGERGCCLGVHYSGLLISIHLLPSAHPTPPATESKGERESERRR